MSFPQKRESRILVKAVRKITPVVLLKLRENMKRRPERKLKKHGETNNRLMSIRKDNIISDFIYN